MVARSQLPDTARNPSPARPRIRIDSHPAGDNADLAAAPDRPRLLDLSDPPDSLSEDALEAIVAQRKGILKSLGIEDAGPFNYPDCGGARTRRARDATQVLPPPKCPADISSYITVGLPYRGAAALLARARPSGAPPPDSTGELWTVLVTESSVGPGGQQWRQYVTLFRRDPASDRLVVAERYLLSWAE